MTHRSHLIIATQAFHFKLSLTSYRIRNRNRNRKLEISTALTKAKSREPAYSQAPVQSKIGRQRVRSRESGRQSVMVDGV